MRSQDAANLSALIEGTETPIWSIDLDHRKIIFNRALYKEIENNFSAKVESGIRAEDDPPPERDAHWTPFYDRALSEGPFWTDYTLADGRAVELFFSPILDNGKATGVTVFAKDVTERKAAEETRQLLATIVDGSDDAILSYTSAGAILTWNRGAEEIFGYSATECIGKHFSLIVTPEKWSGQEKLHADLLKENGESQRDGIGVRKDGRKFHVSIKSRMIWNTDLCEPVVFAIIRDVAKRLDDEQARALLASMMEFSDEAICSATLDGIFLSWNRHSEELFGYTREEILGKNINTLALPSRKGKPSLFLKTIAEGGAIRPFDSVLQRKDGSSVDVSLAISPIRNLAGEVIGSFSFARDITQRKQLESERQEIETKYRSIFDGAFEGMFRTSLEGKCLSVNPSLAKMLGYDSAEDFMLLAGDSAYNVWVDANERSKFIQQLKEQRIVLAFECQFKRKDASPLWVSINSQLIYNTDGQTLFCEGFIEDISKRKQASQALAESEARFRKLFEDNGAVMLLIDPATGVIVDANRMASAYYGYTREQLIGVPISQIENMQQHEITSECQRALREERTRFEFLHRLADGTERNVEVYSAPIEVDGKKLLFSVVHDITERKRTEKALLESTELLRASEEHYRTIFQMSLDAVTISNLDNGKYVDVNQAFLNSMGYERKEVLGKMSIGLNIWADPRDRQLFVSTLRQKSHCHNMEAKLKKKNGEIIAGLVSAAVIELDGVLCVLSLLRDVSSLKEAQEKVKNLAFYDPLTALPNRRLLMERLQHALLSCAQSGRKGALLFIDLDNFKTLNDTLGHHTGDHLLQLVSQRLTTSIREADTVARLGGDEFVVMLYALSKIPEEAAAQAEVVGKKILTAAEQPYWLNGRECLSTLSIGITVFGDKRESTNEVLQHADIAMYQAKAAGRNTMRFFAPALQIAINARASM